MQVTFHIRRDENKMEFYDIGEMFFCTFSSKKATHLHSTNNCNKNVSGDFLYFTFTGKERDEETGYGYFGARYMDYGLLTTFLSVDRYTDKYPSISPYAYCAWNPIRLIDPDGDTITYSGTEEQITLLKGYMDRFKARCPQQYNLLNTSANVYNVQFTPENDDGSGGSFTYASDGHFNVNIKENRAETSSDSYTDIEVLAHELKHAEQYEKRQLGFKIIHSTGIVLPYAYDQQDEIDAAIQAELFAPNSSMNFDNLKKIINHTKAKYNSLPHEQIYVFQQNNKEVDTSVALGF